MQLPPASAEQRVIVDSVVVRQNHVRVDAVAGAGKTTTILHIASALPPDCLLLVLTYNAKLKSETRERCEKLRVKNVSVHTYHSAALNLYGDPSCSRDEGISSLTLHRQGQPALQRHRGSFGVLVVDEAQDMTHLYFALVRRLLRDVCVPDVRVVVMGDARQAVYVFKGADARFLTLAPSLPAFATTSRCWQEHTLTTSYRLAPQLAHFVNSQLLEGVNILRSSHGTPGVVKYVRCNTFGEMPYRQVREWLASGLAGSDIFVLAPSIRANAKQSPVRVLENKLVRAGVRCYAASSDDERLDEDVTRGKVVFATFHQVKGLERMAVLVFNFDASYHVYYESHPSRGCPNPIYVAATRAKQHLTLLHDSKHGPMRTVRMSHVPLDCVFVSDRSIYKGAEPPVQREGESDSDISVTELLRHQKDDVLQSAVRCLRVTDLDKCQASRLLRNKTETGTDSWENVAAITGTALPCMFEYQQSNSLQCTLLTQATHSRGLPPVDHDRIWRLHARTQAGRGSVLSVADFLYIANVHITLTGGFIHKLRQIKVYDWVLQEDVDAMLDVMRKHVTGTHDVVEYEHPACLVLTCATGVQERRIRLSCAVDCLDTSTKTAFEIKCVSVLSSEHILQTALNALLLQKGRDMSTRGFRHLLLNLCDGSCREVGMNTETDIEGVNKAAMILLEARFAAEKLSDDATFLSSLVASDGQAPETTHVPTYSFLDDD